MLLDELATYVAAQGHASTSSTSDWFLVKGQMVDGTPGSTVGGGERVVALRETEGGPPSPRPKFQDASFQLLLRGESISATSGAYENARSQIEDIYFDLHALGSTTLSGIHYIGVWAQQSPYFAGYDERGRPVFLCNFRALRATSS